MTKADKIACSLLWKLRLEIWKEYNKYGEACIILCNADVYIGNCKRTKEIKEKWGKKKNVQINA